MRSLKFACDVIAPFIQRTPASLYERQRALVSAGLLNMEDGRGPGSGVRATPESLAILITSLLAAEGLAESVERTAELLAMIPRALDCPKTGARTFKNAFTSILATPALLDTLGFVTVSRSSLEASFEFQIPNVSFSDFIAARIQAPVAIDISATLTGRTLSVFCYRALPDLYDDGSEEFEHYMRLDEARRAQRRREANGGTDRDDDEGEL
jgi:hypothetical protein